MNLMKKLLLFALALFATRGFVQAQNDKPPVRFAMVGLEHDHARSFIPLAMKSQAMQLVGIIEPRADLKERYGKLFNLDTNLFFPSLEALLAKTNIQAVTTFTSTFDHLKVVEMCAPKGIHVMMEKPLAVNLKAAQAIEAAAKKGGIQIMVNYETTWSAGNQAAYGLIHEEHALGDLRKIVVHDGHRGPKEIGCSEAFLAWLTDPVLNGGGALPDFGCYGADLITWLMDGQRPTSVFAVTQHIKPDVYPKVEDEATVVITYPKTQAILQASWNWPFDRKDMEVYGKTGYVLIPRGEPMRVRRANGRETAVPPPALTGAQADALSHFGAVIRGEVRTTDLSSLPVNMVAMEILDAARRSAESGKRIDFK